MQSPLSRLPLLLLVLLVSFLSCHQGFVLGPAVTLHRQTYHRYGDTFNSVDRSFSDAFVLEAAAGKKKRKRRRRKQAAQPPGATAEDPVKQAQPVVEGVNKDDDFGGDDDEEVAAEEQLTEKDIMVMEDVAKFEFSPPKADVAAAATTTASITTGTGAPASSAAAAAAAAETTTVTPLTPDIRAALKKLEEKTAAKETADAISSSAVQSPDQEMLVPPTAGGGTGGGSDNDAIPLPDIRQALKKKAVEEELKRMEAEKEAARVKIKRSDKEAFRKLLEAQPFADADDSYFVEEEYGTVSALLGEGAATFLGIPSGPLQVSHFIGALVIVLMAFVEYPGFPLTNLPTPLRGGLQGGLATVYAINTVLAVLAAFNAPERGQPRLLWVAKTFSVGGLAYDQLTQLPTLEQIEAAKSRKGARAMKNLKR